MSVKKGHDMTSARTSMVAMPVRIGHRRQVDERFDRSAPELLPHPLIFLPHGLLRRVRRPRDADAPQVFQAHLDRAVAPIQARVKREAQAAPTAAMSTRFLARPAQPREPLFRHRQVAGQELAFGPLELEIEGESVLPLPTCLLRAARNPQRNTSAPMRRRSRSWRACPR